MEVKCYRVDKLIIPELSVDHVVDPKVSFTVNASVSDAVHFCNIAYLQPLVNYSCISAAKLHALDFVRLWLRPSNSAVPFRSFVVCSK